MDLLLITQQHIEQFNEHTQVTINFLLCLLKNTQYVNLCNDCRFFILPAHNYWNTVLPV